MVRGRGLAVRAGLTGGVSALGLAWLVSADGRSPLLELIAATVLLVGGAAWATYLIGRAFESLGIERARTLETANILEQRLAGNLRIARQELASALREVQRETRAVEEAALALTLIRRKLSGRLESDEDFSDNRQVITDPTVSGVSALGVNATARSTPAANRIAVEYSSDVNQTVVGFYHMLSAQRLRIIESSAASLGTSWGSIYLSGGGSDNPDRFIEALSAVLDELDLTLEWDGPPVKGSWWRKFKIGIKRASSSSEAQRLLAKAEVAAQASLLDEPMSRANVQNSTAISQLIDAAERVDNFVVLSGSVLLIKQTKSNGKVSCIAKTLSPSEIIMLERRPEFLRSPVAAFRFLEVLSGQELSTRIQETSVGE